GMHPPWALPAQTRVVRKQTRAVRGQWLCEVSRRRAERIWKCSGNVHEGVAPTESPRVLNTFDDPFPEQSLRPDQQEREGQDVGEPVLDGATDQGAPVDLAELLAHPDDEAADDGARHRGEA